MSEIIRRILHTDLLGQVLSIRDEHLTDDGQGTIREHYTTALARCEACQRPLKEPDEVRGVCVACGRACCAKCEGYCALCHRPLCGDCRVGSVEPSLSVCQECLPLLEQRLERQDRLVDDKATFERTIAICNFRLRLIELARQDGGSVTQLIARLAEIGLARKLTSLEQQLGQERAHGRHRLP